MRRNAINYTVTIEIQNADKYEGRETQIVIKRDDGKAIRGETKKTLEGFGFTVNGNKTRDKFTNELKLNAFKFGCHYPVKVDRRYDHILRLQ